MIRVVIERGWSCMAEFKDILGHEGIIAHLQNAVSMDKISHSYIMSGEDGLGKNMLADAFAKTLQCEEGGITPCGKCRSCIQAESGNQPDIIHVTHEKPNSIGVDDVREQLVDDIVIKPYSSKYKIYIIDEAEKLTVQAQKPFKMINRGAAGLCGDYFSDQQCRGISSDHTFKMCYAQS